MLRKLTLWLFLLSASVSAFAQKVLLDTSVSGNHLQFVLLDKPIKLVHDSAVTRLLGRTKMALSTYDSSTDTVLTRRYHVIDSLEAIWLKQDKNAFRSGRKLTVTCADSAYYYPNEFEADGLIYNTYVYLGREKGFCTLLNIGYEWGGYVFMAEPNLQAASTFNYGFDFTSNGLAYSDFDYMNFSNTIGYYIKRKNSWRQIEFIDMLRRFHFLASDIQIIKENKLLLSGYFTKKNEANEDLFEFESEKKNIVIEISPLKSK